ncbi:MAG TPA: hypothetical protein VHT74_14870 [Acetobacteraceae bacterium]|nr:hypothetical protein [Acetobacteraceae bacterium]
MILRAGVVAIGVAGIVAVGVAGVVAVGVAAIVAIGVAGVVAVGVAGVVAIGVAAIIAIELAHSVVIRGAGAVAIAVMIRPRRRRLSIFAAIRIHVVVEIAHCTAEVLRIGIAGGVHIVQDLAEALARFPERRDLVPAQGASVIPLDLRCRERTGIRLLAR